MTQDTHPVIPADRTEVIYGSVLAASVIAANSPAKSPPPAPALLGALLASGTVFWLVHVYCHVIGRRQGGATPAIRPIMIDQGPVLYAALPPALVAGIGWALGMDDGTTAWLCLLAAVAEMVGWSIEGAISVGASRRFVIQSGMVSALLGIVMILLKAALGH